MAEEVGIVSAPPIADPPKRGRGRPKGAGDKAPRKRRSNSTVGAILERQAAAAAAPPPASDESAKEPPKTRKAAPSERPAPGPQLDFGITNDLERKLKADADWKEAQALKLQLDLEERSGNLISREDHLSDLASRVLTLRKSLLALPARLRDDFALESDPRRIDLRLRHELEALIREYAGQADQAPLDQGEEATA